MKHRILISAIYLVLFVPPTFAIEPNLQKWVDTFGINFPSMMCAQNKVLRSCIKTSDEVCVVGITKTTQTCINRIMKYSGDKKASIELYGQLGSEIGDCAEDIFTIENSSNLIDIPACSDYKNAIENSKWK